MTSNLSSQRTLSVSRFGRRSSRLSISSRRQNRVAPTRHHPQRCRVSDRSSRQDLVVNEDGSVDIYFAPTAPEGYEKNWIQTVPGEAWFAYLRLYAPPRLGPP